jgi:autotransporter-associated beta strand protein
LSGVVSGAGALTKDTGTSTLTLSGTNTYTGATTLSAGTLALSGSGSIATSSGVTVSGDGVLDISATTSGASIVSLDGSSSAAVGVNLGAQTLTLSSASGSYSGVIDGTGGLTLTSGTQTLTGDNTYSGTTTISGGTLEVGDGGSTGALGTGTVTNNGALVFNRGANTSISNVISGTGSVTATITGTLSVDATITTGSGVTLSSTGNFSLNADITNNTSGDITLSAGNSSTASTATFTAATGVVVTQNANADVEMRTDGQGDLTPAQVVKAGTGTGDIVLAAGRLISAGTGTGGQVTPLVNSTVTNSGTGKLLIYSGTEADSGDLSAIDSSLGTLIESGTPTSSINLAYNEAYGSSISNGAYSQVLFRENPYAVTSTTTSVTLPFITLNLAPPSLPAASFNLDLNLEEGLASQLPLDMDIPLPWQLLSSLGNGPSVLKSYDDRPLPNWVALDLEKKTLVLKQAPVSELPLRVWVVTGLQRSLIQVSKMKPPSTY